MKGSRKRRVEPDPALVHWGRGQRATAVDDARAIVATLAPAGDSGSEVARELADAIGADDTIEGRYRPSTQLFGDRQVEVIACRDVRLGREVALKRVLVDDAAVSDRFVREARIQGQLGHPSIVPIYDLARQPDQRPYFTMRRVKGVTIAEVLAGYKGGVRSVIEKYPVRRLLADFSVVCQTLHYAHERGVAHGELSADKILLGKFGEVYVLDWGGARLLDSEGDEPTSAASADIFSLGEILLQLTSLAPRDQEPLADSRWQSGTWSVARDLERVCTRALAPVAYRYRSVGDMHADLEKHLATDRDKERRRELAVAHAEAARRALAPGDSLSARSVAMREAGRALALDPSNEVAAKLIAGLLVESPDSDPEEIAELVYGQQIKTSKKVAWSSQYAYLSALFFGPMMIWVGIRNWPVFLVACVVLIALATLARYLASKTSPSRKALYATVFLNAIFVGSIAYSFSPFMIVPGVAAFSAIAFLLHNQLRPYWVVILAGAVSVVGPLVLEWVGVLEPSYRFDDGALVLLPRFVDFNEGPVMVVLCYAIFCMLAFTTYYVRMLRALQLQAERRLRMQTWHLEQVLPVAAAVASGDRPSR